MKYACVIDGVVDHTCRISEGARTPSSLVYVGNEDPAIGRLWHYVDGVFSAPSQAELDAEAAEQAEQAATTTELASSTLATVTIAQVEQYIINHWDDPDGPQKIARLMARMLIAMRNRM